MFLGTIKMTTSGELKVINISEKLFTFPAVKQTSFSSERNSSWEIKRQESASMSLVLPPIPKENYLNLVRYDSIYGNESLISDSNENRNISKELSPSDESNNVIKAKIYTISPPDSYRADSHRKDVNFSTAHSNKLSNVKVTKQLSPVQDNGDTQLLNQCLRISPFPKLHEDIILSDNTQNDCVKSMPQKTRRKRNKKVKAKKRSTKVRSYKKASERSFVRYTPPKQVLDLTDEGNGTYRRKNRQVMESFRYSYAIDELMSKQHKESVLTKAHISKIEIDHMGREIRTIGPSVLHIDADGERSYSSNTASTRSRLKALTTPKSNREDITSKNKLLSFPSLRSVFNDQTVIVKQRQNNGCFPDVYSRSRLPANIRPKATSIVEVCG